MEFYYYSPSETFVVLTADQFVGHDDALLEQQKQGSHVCLLSKDTRSTWRSWDNMRHSFTTKTKKALDQAPRVLTRVQPESSTRIEIKSE